MPPGPRRPARTSRRRRRTRTALGLSALALGTVAVLGLGGSPSGARPGVDPAGDDLLVDHAGTTAELPLPDPAGVVQAGLAR